MSKKALVFAVAGVLVVGGIAFGAVAFFFGPSEDRAISLVPSDAFVYGNVFIRPSNGQKMAIEDILEAAGQTPDEVRDLLSELLDPNLEGCDATFEGDVDPWLGDQIAFFLTAPAEPAADPSGTALIDTRDQEGAEEFLEKCRDLLGAGEDREARSYEGIGYDLYEAQGIAVGFVEGFLAGGTESGFRAAVDASRGGDSLADAAPFREVAARIHEDNLAFFYLNARPAVDAARQLEELSAEDEQVLNLLGDALDKPYATALFATSDGLVIESANPWPSDGPLAPVLEIVEQETGLEELPADSWMALGFPEIGRLAEVAFETALEFNPEDTQAFVGQFEAQTGLSFRDDIVDGIGDARLFFGGEIGSGGLGALVVETSDEETATRLVDAVRATLSSDPITGPTVGPLLLDGYDDGFSVSNALLPDSVHVVVDGNRIVAGLEDDATRSALEGDATPLRDSEVFRDARELLGDDYEPYMFVDLHVLVGAFRTFIAPITLDFPSDDADRILDAFSHLTVGAKRDGDYIMQRVVIGAEQEDR